LASMALPARRWACASSFFTRASDCAPHHQTEKHAKGVSIRKVREEIILRELGLKQPEMGPPCKYG
jgi:hypothetical protein